MRPMGKSACRESSWCSSSRRSASRSRRIASAIAASARASFPAGARASASTPIERELLEDLMGLVPGILGPEKPPDEAFRHRGGAVRVDDPPRAEPWTSREDGAFLPFRRAGDHDVRALAGRAHEFFEE